VIHTYTGHVLGGTVMRTYNRAIYAASVAISPRNGGIRRDLIGDR
jgi:hypothetical protein